MSLNFPIIVYDKIAKLVGGILFSAIILGFVIFLLVMTPNHYKVWQVLPLVALFAIPLFGTAIVLGIIRLVKKKPSLIINELGILDNTSALSPGFISWGEVAEIKETSYWGHKAIGINLKDINSFMTKIGRLRSWPIKKYIKAGNTHLLITDAMLPVSSRELVNTIINKIKI